MEVKVMQDILGQNDAVAGALRQHLAAAGVYTLNLLGSPGAGKTSLLERTLAVLSGEMRIAVIEGDLFTTKDADRIAKTGVSVVQINTSGGCHLDAPMVEKALTDERLKIPGIDLLIIENVGNLVCPAEFDVGEDEKAVVLSVTEGNDKPMKYPLIFKESALTVINKVDLAPYTDFDVAAAREDIQTIHPGALVLPLSCRTGEGVEDWFAWLRARVKAKREGAGKDD